MKKTPFVFFEQSLFRKKEKPCYEHLRQFFVFCRGELAKMHTTQLLKNWLHLCSFELFHQTNASFLSDHGAKYLRLKKNNIFRHLVFLPPLFFKK